MIDLNELLPFIPNQGIPIIEKNFTFTLFLRKEYDDESAFTINLKIKQKDTKEEHLINFRLGIEKHSRTTSPIHDPSKPHFEIEIYKREKESFSATLYFTFNEINDKSLMNYAKGTLVIIEKIIENFINNYKLNSTLIEKLIYKEPVLTEFGKYEHTLIKALYKCFKNNDLIVKKGTETITIKTKHNLAKYLKTTQLEPLYLPLIDMVEKDKHTK